MNKFSKITGLISFWTRVIIFLGRILITIFQKQIMKIFYSPTLDITIFPFEDVFITFVLLLIVGLFYYKKNINKRSRAIISLYFYLLVTVLFSNPLVSNISAMLTGMKGSEYMVAKSVLSTALQAILYIFVLTSNVCFYLSAGALIVSNDYDNHNKEIETDVSEKSRTKLILYSGFLGIFGIDRFYAKRIGTGIVKVLLGLPIVITVIRILSISGSNDFSDPLSAFFLTFSYAFAINQSDSFLPSILIAIIPYLPITVFSIMDFVLCVLGKFKDSDNKLIVKW